MEPGRTHSIGQQAQARPAEPASYWPARLAGAVPAELRVERARPAGMPAGAGHCQVAFPAGVVRGLRALASSAGTELPVLLLACYLLLVGRAADREDVVLGYCGLPGHRAVPVRADLSGDPSFLELVHQVQSWLSDLAGQDDVDFGPLLGGPAAAAGSAAEFSFKVMFCAQTAAQASDADLAGADLALLVSAGRGRLTVRLRYRPEVLGAAAAARMASHLGVIVAAAAAGPDRSLSALPHVTAAEYEQLVEQWNDTAAGPVPAAGVHELFLAQETRTPDAVAVSCGDRSLSYAEMRTRVGKLASHLRRIGVGPEVVVGVALDRGIDMVVALLAIWQAGGAYLPLDPGYPAERLGYMVADSGTRLVLSTRDLAADFAGHGVSVSLLDDPATAAAIAAAPDCPVAATHPEQLAYVIYTSGSTGRPKGVVACHSGVLNRLLRMQDSYQLLADERVVHKAPLAFDASVWELFWPLAVGAELVVVEPGHHRDLDHLVALLEARRLSVVHFVPSLFRLLVSRPLPLPPMPWLRLVFCSGEALAAEDVARFHAINDTAAVGNLYGPTETSIEAVTAECGRPIDTSVPPPIGRPIGNVRVYVLDEHLNVLPVGAAGELFIGGAGVTRGYRGRPALTAERFVANPFGGDGSRLYRSGDRVRWRADSQIDYLGRVDHQVKVRGVRIEPGEVEATLRACPMVADTVVVAQGSSADRRLVAYLVPDGGRPTASALRAFLRTRLPDYLIPSAFVTLAAIPVSPNGKVDRAALPAPGATRPELAGEFMPPGRQVEHELAGIWASILGLDEVGVTDNFFDLGGHSLAATQVASRVRAQLGIELRVSALFEEPTIRGLAALLDGAQARSALPAIAVADRGQPLPLSFAQQRLWFLHQLAPESAEYNEPLALRLTGQLDAAMLGAALDQIVARHEVLRTRLVAGPDGVAHQVIDPPASIGLPLTDLSGAADPLGQAKDLHAAVAREPFVLDAGPLLRARLMRLGPDDHVLSLCMHHVVCDEWSVALLRREVAIRYAALRRDREPRLAPLPVQYADFAIWQRGWLRGELLERQLGYWRAALTGAPVLDLPTDLPRPPVRSAAGGRVEFSVPAEVSAGLRAVARSAGATMFMTLFGVYTVLLSRLTGQDDIVVGTPIANRNHAETEDLIGFFVNTLVLRTDASGDPSFRELLGRVRDVALAAYNHQDLPFEQLIDALNADRDRSRTPLFQALFNYNQADVIGGAAQAESELGVTLAELPADVAAKFDLRLIFTDGNGPLTGALEYATALFTAPTMRRLVDLLQLNLAAVAGDAGLRLTELPAMTEAERRELAAWNGTPAPVAEMAGAAGPAMLPALIAGQAARTPDAPAVLVGDTALSYAALAARASQLAHYLRGLGVGHETVVGLLLTRPADTLTALLGVWLAGAAYLPLDPRHPASRLDYQLADSRVAILLSGTDAADTLPAGRARSIALDDPVTAAAIAQAPDTPPATVIHPGQVAYVCYTSGSTGQPKGVWVSHGALASYVRGVTGRAGLGGAGRRYALLQSAVTDFGNTTIFTCLSTGGTLCLPSQELAADPAAVSAYLRDQRIDYLKIVPSHLAALAGATDLATLLPARTLVLGGEAAPPSLVTELAALAGSRLLVNHYGPTETTIGASTSRLDGSDVRIGHALPGARLYVTDRQLRQVPVGVAGELCIAGTGLARGYGGRPGLSAERFVADPVAGDGSRMYRTGDRVRRWPDGQLEFLGRMDHQVKIRGHRIEPAEIEAALLAHPAITAAVVVAADEGTAGQPDTGRRLVGYLVPADHAGGELVGDELRGYLRRTLPEQLIPAAFVLLSELPLTSNGKVDRSALPAPGDGRPELAGGYQRPRTPAEELLAAIWTDTLGIKQIGSGDNFFDLGGNSLLATSVISRIRIVFELELPLAELFDHPTVADLAIIIDGAGARRAGQADSVPRLIPVPRDQRLPLSFAQQRLWFLSQLSPGSTEYNNTDAIRLRGALDTAALRAALDAMAARHEVMRTRLVAAQDGVPYQVIDPASAFPLAMSDFSGEAEPLARARELLAVEAAEPFDLAAGPVARGRLIRLGPDDHVLCLCLHHVVSDEWSALVLRGELAALYDAFQAGQPLPLAPLPLQYADFAAWQRGWLTGEVLDRQLGYWRDQLADAPVLELPADYPRPAVRSSAGAMVTFTVPAQTAAGLRAVAREVGATMFMTLLAGFTMLLSRYTGLDDIVVGTPIANRTRSELESLVGFFVNTLVLRADLSGDPTFTELVGRVRRAALSGYAHQDVPFEQVVDALQPERDRSRTPLFQVLFSMDRVGYERLAFPGLASEPLRVGTEEARFDLALGCTDDRDRLGGTLLYSTELFSMPTAARLADHLVTVFGAVAAAPGLHLSEVSPLTSEQRARAVAQACRLGPRAPGAAVHTLVAAQAAARPAAIATIFDGMAVSYAELDTRANRLANYLRALGVGQEVMVGLCLGRGTEQIVALLAVLKAGGAYLPVDPDYPVERISRMLSDSQASVLLGQSAVLDLLPPVRTRVVALDDPATAAAIRSAAATVPDVAVHPDQLAYLMYTSGSTGLPKGIGVCHRDITALVTAADYAPISDDDVVAQAATTTFDAATFEIWGALANGAMLAGIDSETLLAPARLSAWLDRLGVTVLFVTTALFNRLAADAPDGLARLRHVLFGGEAVDPASVRRVLEQGPPQRLLHVYGPTETTTFASWHLVDEVPAETVPIGGPLPGMRLLVLDKYLEPVPPGVPGELYIGGAGLARGYVNRPALTTERFVADPFAVDGSRLYRSGDLVRQRPDGAVEFLGRADQQVKIRGFRIEPAEVEIALLGHPEIAQAVVMARQDTGDRRLVAYLVPADQAAGIPSASELRGFLRRSLPDFLIPAAYVELAALPLNRNGKVDRPALPVPDDSRPDLATDFALPSTPTEVTLASLWAEVLGLSEVGADDNFFELGGHSLLATQVVSRLRSMFGTELTLAALFDQPTVRQFAAVVDAAAPSRSAPPIGPAGRDRLLPLSYAQQRLWFLDQLEPASAEYNIPVTLRLRGPLDAAALRASLTEVVRRHEVLRTRLVTVDGVASQVIDPPAGFPLDVTDLAGRPDPLAAARTLAAAGAAEPFDISAGPLLRGRLLRLADDDHVLCLVMHHIVSDEWSAGVLRRELSALYQALRAGQPSPLPPLPVQYADFAVWQRNWLTGDVLAAQLSYWQDTLAGAAALELPTDRPRPAVRSSAGALVDFSVPEQTMAGLGHVCHDAGATMFMVLLAAFSVLLGRHADQDDVVVGTPIANRNHAETEDLIGFFVNTLVLRTDLSGDPTFTELAGRVRAVALGGYGHQDLPFEQLVDAAQPQRDRSRTPLFQVFFNHLGVAGGPSSPFSPDLTESELRLPHTTAKFDLTLFTHSAGRGLTGTLEYRTDLFERATIERLAGHFTNLLCAVAVAPRRPLSELSELTPAEREQVLVTWNDTAEPQPAAGGVHELIAAQAASSPDAMAVRCAGHQLSYAELMDRAGLLACQLRAVGVRAETVVGVCLDRSVDLIVALLGIWQAGGVYLPLDPGYPASRLRYLIADSGAPVVIGQPAAVPDGVTVLRLEEPGTLVAAGSAMEVTGEPVHPGQLAYLIYTSGSTGQPKGVLAHHRGLVNRLAWMQRQYQLQSGERVLHKTPATFDVSLWELLWPLAAGGCLVMAEPGRQADLDYLTGLLGREQISVTHFVPSLFHQLAAHDWAAAMPDLRLVVCSGEALVGGDVARFYARHPAATVENLYGPTEAAIDVSWWSCPRPGDAAAPPIGRPIANTRLYVLDRSLHPVPPGVTGELYIAGVAIARGYANRPALTAERFVADPFTADGARLYRTGDRSKWRADGQIEFLGRADHQVKLRGFRIEPGEVEAALTSHPAVATALVTVASRGGGTDQRLVAYVTPTDPAQGVPSSSDLRAHLRRTLPDYMIPAIFMDLAALPLTANGKVDRAALPSPDASQPDASQLTAPRTTAEQTLAAIWAEVLGLRKVGVTDNFFELGGDSIISIQVVSRARRRGLHLTPAQLFEHQTIAELAAHASRRDLVQAEQGTVTGELPLTPIQHLFVARDLPEPGHYNQSRLLKPLRPLGAEPLRVALAELLTHHDALRLRLTGLGGTADGLRLYCAAAEEAEVLAVLDVGGLDEQEEQELVAAAARTAHTSLDLSAGPLVRAVLVDRGPRGQQLLLVIHHLAVDAVSWQILVDDLAAAYQMAEAGRQVRLPAKTTSVKRWSERLAELAGSAGLLAEAEYWRSAPVPVPVPRDYRDGRNDLARARTVCTELSARQTGRLLHEVPAAYRTQINDALVTVLAVVIGEWAGGDAVTIDLEGHGREDIGPGFDVSRTVGWFTTSFPVTVPVPRPGELGAGLKQVKEQLRTLPRHGLSYGVLRYMAVGEASALLRAGPAAEVGLNYLGQPERGGTGAELFQVLPHSLGPERAPAGMRGHLLELDARVVDDQLELAWTYSDQVHDEATVRRLAGRYLELLGELIEHCAAPGAGGYTPSDFPLAGLDQAALDALQRRLGAAATGESANAGGRS